VTQGEAGVAVEIEVAAAVTSDDGAVGRSLLGRQAQDLRIDRPARGGDDDAGQTEGPASLQQGGVVLAEGALEARGSERLEAGQIGDEDPRARVLRPLPLDVAAGEDDASLHCPVILQVARKVGKSPARERPSR
jgi:hypothetical protein